jgi:hypothetical protein
VGLKGTSNATLAEYLGLPPNDPSRRRPRPGQGERQKLVTVDERLSSGWVAKTESFRGESLLQAIVLGWSEPRELEVETTLLMNATVLGSSGVYARSWPSNG